MIGNSKINKKKTEAASIIAELLNVSPRYVRMVMRDIKKEKYKGVKPERIRQTYYTYQRGKTALIRSIENQIKVA